MVSVERNDFKMLILAKITKPLLFLKPLNLKQSATASAVYLHYVNPESCIYFLQIKHDIYL